VRFGLVYYGIYKTGAPADNAESAPQTSLQAPDKRPSLGGPAGEKATDEAKPAAADQGRPDDKPQDPASKIVKLDNFRKK
jgi:hypothetical protein